MTDLVFSPAQASIPSYQTILTEKVSPFVLKVSLNRPEVSNAFNTLMGQELEDLWNRLILDTQGFRAIVLTATG